MPSNTEQMIARAKERAEAKKRTEVQARRFSAKPIKHKKVKRFPTFVELYAKNYSCAPTISILDGTTIK